MGLPARGVAPGRTGSRAARWTSTRQLVERSRGGVGGGVVMGREDVQRRRRPVGQRSERAAAGGATSPRSRPVFVVTHHPREPLELTGTPFPFRHRRCRGSRRPARDGGGRGSVDRGRCGDRAAVPCRGAPRRAGSCTRRPLFLGGGTRLFDDGTPAAEARGARGRRSPARDARALPHLVLGPLARDELPEAQRCKDDRVERDERGEGLKPPRLEHGGGQQDSRQHAHWCTA